MKEDKRPVTRTDSALAELKAITDLLITRCCQHAADSGDMANRINAALAEIAKRDAMIADFEAQIAAEKEPEQTQA